MIRELKILMREPGRYVIEVRGEDHTLGNLLTSKLNSMKEVNLAYYEIPHPLEDLMVIYIDADPKADVKSLLIKAAEQALEELGLFKRMLIDQLREKGVEVENYS